MIFDPKPGTELLLGETAYRICAHPLIPNQPYVQEGRAGRVYKLEGADQRTHLALKVFHPPFRDPALVEVSQSLRPLASTPGLRVCDFTVLHTRNYPDLIQDYSDLIYALVMPWIQGPTWQEVVVGGMPELKPERCLSLALSLVDVLALMEQRKVAHCDISGGNILLPGVVEGAGGYPLEFVDVEQMYSPQHSPPDILPKGSPGYAHFLSGAPNYWSPRADRFAGAVLVAEVLAWWDPEIRAAKSGESYFSPDSVADDRVRSELILKSLDKRWGPKVSALLKRALESQSLDLCPVFEEWRAALMAAGRLSQGPKAVDAPKKVSGAEAKQLMDRGRRLEDQGRLEEALEAYCQVLEQPGLSKGLQAEVPMLIEDIERALAERSKEPDLPPAHLDLLVNPAIAAPSSEGSEVLPPVFPTKSNTLVKRGALAAVALVALVGLGIWAWKTFYPGTVRISVSPQTVHLDLDGKPHADISEGNELKLKPGRYELTARMEGYNTRTEFVTVEAGATTGVDLTLSRSKGTLVLRTVPKSVLLKIDGKPQPSAYAAGSPLELPIGQHEITVGQDTFNSQVLKVNIEEGKEVAFEVQLVPYKGSLHVVTDPPGAVLFLDGKKQAKRSSTTLTGLEPGKYELTAELEDHATKIEKVEVVSGQEKKITMKLERIWHPAPAAPAPSAPAPFAPAPPSMPAPAPAPAPAAPAAPTIW